MRRSELRGEFDGKECAQDRQKSPAKDGRQGETLPLREVPAEKPEADHHSGAVVLPELRESGITVSIASSKVAMSPHSERNALARNRVHCTMLAIVPLCLISWAAWSGYNSSAVQASDDSTGKPAASTDAFEQKFQATVRPFLERYCF